MTMAMLVDHINQHQTRTNQNISSWIRLEFILVSAVVFSKTYCVGVSLWHFFHVLTILFLSAGDSLHSRPPVRARGHARKAVHWAKDPRIRYELLKRPNGTGGEPWVSVSVQVCTVLPQSGRMTLCTMIHWHQPRGSLGLDCLRTHHMLFWAQCQSHEECRA